MPNARILPPNPARLIEGLRDTGYDFNTALADIVDNAVDAMATHIDIRIVLEADGSVLVAVADNGCGMNMEELLEGMKYGSEGATDPKRLGKFGLGMKTASTAFCRRFSVITRDSLEDKPIKATWDLDHVTRVHQWELLISDPGASELALLNHTAENSSGTLILWEKVDRLIKEYSDPTGKYAQRAIENIAQKFREHASMVYQRFLDFGDDRARDIIMKVNDDQLLPWDPFCKNENETEMVAQKEEANFDIAAFILPRRERFSSPEAAADARLSNNMQGIYIYRENRLIHPADWLGMWSKEPHTTLMRVEFSFDHRLDQAFHVDIKKSRILLDDELYTWMKEQFLPAPRNAANERYRTGQRQKVKEGSKTAHEISSRFIQDQEYSLRTATVDIVNEETGEVDITNAQGTFRLKLSIGEPSNPGQVCVDQVDSLDDGLLWEPAIIDGHHAVRINVGHPYYRKVYVPNYSSDVTIQGMDALLWALVEAEFATINAATKRYFEELRYEVSRLLRKLLEDLPEPDLDV